jgi:hypothetical protein
MTQPHVTGKPSDHGNGRPVSLEALARAKGLPAAFLRELHLQDLPGGGVAIPYLDVGGEEIAVKRRLSLVAGKGSYWPKGRSLAAYGEWLIGQANRAGYVILVEGESDAWVLWYHQFPALGIPGWGGTKVLNAEHLACVPKVFVHHEPDEGGDRFVSGVKARLRQLAWPGQALELRCPEGVKDPADLHLRLRDDPEAFRRALEDMMAKAARLDLGKPAAPAAEVPEPQLVCLDSVQAGPVCWLWRPWVPRGAVTLMDGDPGLGKSTLALDLSARLSRGWEMPPAAGPAEGAEPEAVLLLSAEDDLARTIRPRLDAAGADVRRIHFLDAVRVGGDERPPVLPWDLSLVETTIRELGITLVVVDPFLAYLDSDIDSHRDQDVRRCLHRMKQLAERLDVAIILIRHLNKLIGGPALYRGGGSIGITGAVRSALIVGRDPNDAQTFVLAGVKSNLGPPPVSLAYQLQPVGDVARVVWVGETPLLANDILGHGGGGERRNAAQQCADAIREILAGKVMNSDELDRQLRDRRFGEHSIRTGKRLAGLKTTRIRFGGNCLVELDKKPEGQPEAARQ